MGGFCGVLCLRSRGGAYRRADSARVEQKMGHGMKQRKKSVKRGDVQYSLSLDVSSWGMKSGLDSNYDCRDI